MSKLSLPRFESGFSTTSKLNQAMEQIEEAVENTLSRDGTAPNQLQSDLDLNGNAILNSGSSDDPNRVVTFSEMTGYISGVAAGLVVQKQELQTATAAQTVFNLTTLAYTPGTFNLAVYVDGVRKFSPTDYAETDADTVTFVSGLSLGAKVEFVTNEYLGNTALPNHTHPWNQITGAPSYATRDPTWDEVTGKPTTFPVDPHNHDASALTSGRVADARRGVFVQSTQPASPQVGDLWFW